MTKSSWTSEEERDAPPADKPVRSTRVRTLDVSRRAPHHTAEARMAADAASAYAGSPRARLGGGVIGASETLGDPLTLGADDDGPRDDWWGGLRSGATRRGVRRAPFGVALLDADPDFRSGVPADALATARRTVVVPRLDLDPGPWQPPPLAPWPTPVTGVVVITGVMARDVVLGNRVATHFIGPGDVVDPWGAQDDMLPCAIRWRACEPTVLAALDARFAIATRRWPSLAVVVVRKLCQRADRLAAQAAALQLPRVEERVLAVLWQLAERFGRVRREGVIVPFKLSHHLLGQLVGARRPTVSLAIKELIDADHLLRADDGCWILAPASRAALEPDAPPA
jgi:CRP-like cAMP-binding protein